MEPSDLTIKILQEIREEMRGHRADNQRDFVQLREEIAHANAESAKRFAVIESTLKDLAEQMIMLARGIKTALEVRGRMDDVERRLTELEKREPH